MREKFSQWLTLADRVAVTLLIKHVTKAALQVNSTKERFNKMQMPQYATPHEIYIPYVRATLRENVKRKRENCSRIYAISIRSSVLLVFDQKRNQNIAEIYSRKISSNAYSQRYIKSNLSIRPRAAYYLYYIKKKKKQTQLDIKYDCVNV